MNTTVFRAGRVVLGAEGTWEGAMAIRAWFSVKGAPRTAASSEPGMPLPPRGRADLRTVPTTSWKGPHHTDVDPRSQLRMLRFRNAAGRHVFTPSHRRPAR